MDRRSLLGSAAGAALGMSLPALPQAPDAGRAHGFRFDDPLWNRDAYVRIQGDTRPGTQLHGYATGIIHGVREGEAIRPLIGYYVFSSFRMLRNPDGSWRRLLRDLVLFTDVARKRFLETWDNPYTGERVRVVDFANDQINVVYDEYMPGSPPVPGANGEPPKRPPLRLDWRMWPGDFVMLETDSHFWSRSPMQPAEWPRESPGPMSVSTSLYRYFIRAQDLANPAMTHVPHNGTWGRIIPWLPWMLMGQAPGHVLYQGVFTTTRGLDTLPPSLVARVREKYPLWLEAPDDPTKPTVGSIENYMKTQRPAKAK